MIKRYSITNNALVESNDDTATVIVYINPNQNEQAMLCSLQHIDGHTVSSALDPDEVARIESSGNTVSLIWKRAMNCSGKDNFYFNVGSLGLFLTNDRLVVVMDDDAPLLESGIRYPVKFATPLELVLNILLGTIDQYLGHLKTIKLIAHDLQQRINRSMQNEHLIQMFNLSESLVYYTNAIAANGIVLGRLRTLAEKLNYDVKIVEILDDIIIENNQCYKQSEIYSTVFSGLMDARGSLVNNNMSMLLKNLTIINIVFLPLNLLAGIGGMSEFTMMTEGIDWRISYSIFMGVMIILGWVIAYSLGKLSFNTSNPFDWFGRKQKKIKK
jgi:magnesium transporter